jgi:hypothetical protein
MASTYLGDTIFVNLQSPLESNTDTVDEDPNLKKRMVMIDPEDLIGRTDTRRLDAT